MSVSIASPQNKIISLKVVGRALRSGGCFASSDIWRELGNNFRGEFTLNGEDVGNLPVEAARPEMRAGLDVNQLCRDAEPVTLAARTAFHHVGNTKLLSELAHIAVLPLHGIGGVARDNLKFGIPCERRSHVLGQPICKVGLVSAAAHGSERHNRHGRPGSTRVWSEDSAAGRRLTIAASGKRLNLGAYEDKGHSSNAIGPARSGAA